MRIAIASAAAGNYVSFARVLARSLHEHHPEIPVFLCLSDSSGERLDPAHEPFELFDVSDLPIPNLRAFLFRYTRRQAAIAVKPFLLEHVLDQGFETVVYVDADILVLGRLNDLLEAARSNAITLLPHLLEPLETHDRIDRELNILQSGVFNGGVVGVGDTREGRRFLAWWQDRVHLHCRHAVAEGLHHDQRWLDLAPALFEDVQIFRDPTINTAHWNLPERDVARSRLFHFSGFEPDRPGVLTRYSDRLSLGDVEAAAQLFPPYVRALLDAGWEATQGLEHAYGSFDNGVPIPDVARAVYSDLGEAAIRFGDPFRTTGSDSFYHWLARPADGNGDVSRLWRDVHARRPDLQAAFPDLLGADREAFQAWVRESGAAEHAVPVELV
jgi:hypothetical protein